MVQRRATNPLRDITTVSGEGVGHLDLQQTVEQRKKHQVKVFEHLLLPECAQISSLSTQHAGIEGKYDIYCRAPSKGREDKPPNPCTLDLELGVLFCFVFKGENTEAEINHLVALMWLFKKFRSFVGECGFLFSFGAVAWLPCCV